jgi:hypothetical protein
MLKIEMARDHTINLIDLFLDRDQRSINDRKLLKMIFFCEYAYILCQNKLKLYSSTDFTPLD